jgi:CheY-like chemotaxis protein
VTIDRPLLRCFPRADRAFQREVDRLFDEWARRDVSATPDPAAFERELRQRYPACIVRPQDPLASLTEVETVWYVHRRDEPVVPAVDGAVDSGPNATPPGPAGRVRGGPGTTPTYSASRVAEMVGLPMSVLVSWDEKEHLVRPARTSSGLALYSRDDVDRLLRAKRAFAAGRSSEDVRQMLAEHRALARAGHGGLPGRRLLVLLAEKDPYAAEFSEYFLRTEGYEVEVALSATEAEARALELQPDLAVVELLISGGSGPELCARLKARPGAKVLAISSLDHEDEALRAGADAFVGKPFEPLAFVSAVKDLLGESAMLRPAPDSASASGMAGRVAR